MPTPTSRWHAAARSRNPAAAKTSRHGVSALEMTKWFDTNYHYMVPELTKDQTFTLASTKVIDEFREAKALGFKTRPVLLGPVTLLKLSKADDGSFNPLSLLDRLLPVYSEILRHLRDSGADWVQIDEPALVLDLNEQDHAALQKTYQTFSQDVPDLKLMLTSYFGALGDNPLTPLCPCRWQACTLTWSAPPNNSTTLLRVRAPIR